MNIKRVPANTVVKKKPYKRGWTKDEHFRFLQGLQLHGKGEWKEISEIVKTRTPVQIQSHAQKYYQRQQQKNKTKKSIHDFTVEDLKDMTQADIMEQSKYIRENSSFKGYVLPPAAPQTLDFSQFGMVPYFAGPMLAHGGDAPPFADPTLLAQLQATQQRGIAQAPLGGQRYGQLPQRTHMQALQRNAFMSRGFPPMAYQPLRLQPHSQQHVSGVESGAVSVVGVSAHLQQQAQGVPSALAQYTYAETPILHPPPPPPRSGTVEAHPGAESLSLLGKRVREQGLDMYQQPTKKFKVE